MKKPYCLSFNIAVHAICARLFPCGYDVAERAPTNLEDLTAHIARTGRMLVWSGASDNTIYGDSETNWAFRAWHDWCHWKGQHEFNLVGERACMEMQLEHLRTVYGRSHPDFHLWAAILEAEIIAQASIHAESGEFPADQRQFTESLIEEILYCRQRLAA